MENGCWLCLKPSSTEELAKARVFCNSAIGQYDAELKRHRDRRSLDANAYFWTLCNKLALYQRLTPGEVYRHLVRDIGGNKTIICVKNEAVESLCAGWEHNGLGWITETFPSKIEGCTNVTLTYGSSTYDTKQMSELIDAVVFECKEQGIETLTPAELERMKQEWQ